MSPDKALRKKQRAVLNTLREACIYGTPLILNDGVAQHSLIPLEVREKGYRDLDEVRMLVFRGGERQIGPSPGRHSIQIEHQGEMITLPLKNPLVVGDKASWEFRISEATSSNRRSSDRQIARESFLVPVLFYFEDPRRYPISGFARIMDYDQKAIRFELRIRSEVPESEFGNGKVLFQDSTFFPDSRLLPIHRVRSYRKDEQAGLPLTLVVAVSFTEQDGEQAESRRSIIQPREIIKTHFRAYLRDIASIEVSIQSLVQDGFIGSTSPREAFTLPRFFVAEHSETRIRFNVSKREDGLHFHRASSSFGTKAQWMNYITHKGLGYEYRFQPKDAKEITRLMLESGGYTSRAISDLTLLHGYLQYKWPIEEALPRTKYRWLVRDDEGAVIGHTAGVRVSESLWAAIDNIGSQNYQGSWNREFVARWIRAFAEFLDGHESQPVVQWTFSPSAGIWTKFDEMISGRSDLLHSRERFWNLYLVNLPDSGRTEKKNFSIQPIEHSSKQPSPWSELIELQSKPLFHSLFNGIESGSAFHSDFEQDYAQSFKRFSYVVNLRGRPTFFLTFTNYPDWASFNKGHDWHYLFPLSSNLTLSPEEELELLVLVKETVFRSGCTPYRMCIVSESIRLSQGVEFTNFLLRPPALEFAARSLEDT